MQTPKLEIVPIEQSPGVRAPLGVEVRGVDARSPPSPELAAQLRDLVAEHCCVLLRGQELTEEQHVDFVAGFGDTVVPWLHAVELGTRERMDELPGRPGYTGTQPGVVYFYNGPRYRDKPDDGYLQVWHADMTHLQVSLPLVFLHALEAPQHGYETWLSNQYLAYERLDEETRARIDGLLLPHSFRHIFPNLPPVLHPIALEHPLSRRTCIFGIPGSAEAVPVGLTRAEADELMRKLTAHLDDEAFVYKHRWRTGDILIWDNRCALHRRGPQAEGQTRILRRVMASDGHMFEQRRAFMGRTGHGQAGDGRASAPLSFAQERFWLLEELETIRSASIPVVLRLSGLLDVDLLRRALHAVVDRHDVLRTRIVVEDGEPRQRVDPDASLALEVVSLANEDPAARDAALRALLDRAAAAPFDLAHGPLVQLQLIERGADDHVLCLTAHHTVWDRDSTGLFLRDLRTSYEDLLAGGTGRLPTLERQIAELAHDERRAVEEPRAQELLAYWKERLAGLEPLEFPTDRPRPRVQGDASDVVERAVPRSLTLGLEALARENRTSLATLACAAFQALLARTTGSEDVAVGLPVSQRTKPGLEPMVGLLLDTVVVRTDLTGDPSFLGELVPRVHHATLAAYEHQDVPFQRLVAALDVPRDASRAPLHQVLFSMLSRRRGTMQLGPVEVRAFSSDESEGNGLETVDPASLRTQLDLELRVVEHPGGLLLRLIYDVELFDRDRVERLAACLVQLFESIVARPGARLSQLDVVDADEEQRLLAAGTGAAPSRAFVSLTDLFHARASERPDAVAWIDDATGARTSYGEALHQVGELAGALVAAGVQPGDTVGLLLPRPTERVLAQLAVLWTGARILPLSPGDPPLRLAHLLTVAAARLVLADAEMQPFTDEADARFTSQTALLEKDHEPLPAPVAVAAADAATVFFTSGTTGTPKGVVGSHGGWANRVFAEERCAPWGAEEVACHKTNPVFVDAVLEVFGPLCAGVPLVLLGSDAVLDPVRFVERLAEHRVTRLVLVPTALELLLTAVPDLGARLPALTRWTLSGEPLSTDLVARLRRSAPVAIVRNVYGTTEVAADATAWTLAPEATTDPTPTVPIGTPLDGVHVRVLDRWGRLAATGVPGELHVGGAGLALDVLGPEPEARFVTAGSDATRLYRTGDRAPWRSDGALELLGRLDAQVQVRGVRVEPDEVEHVLARAPGVERVVVRVGETRTAQPALVAYVLAAPGTTGTNGTAAPTRAALMAHASAHLPASHLPSEWVFLDDLPRTSNGKLDEAALRSLVPAPRAEATGDEDLPASPLEEALATIWCEALSLERVRRSDRFLDLGGHSLLAVTVVARIEAELGVRVRPLDLLFADLAQLAVRCEEEGSRKPSWFARIAGRLRHGKSVDRVSAEGGAGL